MLTVSRSLCFLACLHFSGLLFAQQPRVYRDRVDPNWLADGAAFWYRVALPGGESEFLLVNTVPGNREPAFDHARVADKLSKLTGRNFAPEKLPFTTIEFDDQMKTVTLDGGRDSWILDLSTYMLESQSTPGSELPGKRFFSRKRKSVNRGGDVQLEIHNALSTEVDLVWVNRSGSLQTYGTLKPGQKRSQHTFAGHVWLVQSEGEPLAYFEAAENDNVIELTEDAIKGLREQAEKPDAPARNKSRRRTTAAGSSASSPDGKLSAYVEGHNLWLQKLPATEDSQNRQLSRDGSAENSFRKDASRARLVEMNYDRSDPPENVADVRWSPNSKYIVAFQATKVPEPRVHYVESSPKEALQPRLNSYPYAKPGDAIPVSTPRLFSVGDSREIALSSELFPNPFKLQFLKWSEDGSRFWMLYNERGHQRLRVLEVNVADGSVRAVVDESSESFIHYSTSGKFVLEWMGETELLWASERSGWNHLYRYDVATGQPINAVTSGEWNVRRIEHIDREAGVVWFYAVGVAENQDPYHEHFCRVDLDGSGFTVLTQGDGTHEIQWSPDRKFFIDRFSRVDMGPVSELRQASDSTLVVALEQADVSEIVKARGRLPQRFVAKGRDGVTDIYGLIHFPQDFDPQLKYPVVENIYAGPHDHHVPKAFRTSYRHQHQIADRGIIVVQIDGMGTAWRSKAFHDVCYKNLRDAGFPDRIAWLKAAAKEYPFIDVGRVGIYGGSAGGQNAMAALLWHGTFYKAAVADCGCHDNRMDKLWWNEQWMGWPVDEAYAANSNTENAHQLQGKLMLVVGELDRNVDPASTTQVVDALIKANKDFTFLPIPGVGHGACERPYGSRKRAEFLATYLKAKSAE